MSQLKWWQTAVFYQIYPRSFADGNGDGIGDFSGLTAQLDYLAGLGVDALWLSPHFPSPNWDCGYDISDYRGIAPEYGSPDDFKVFLTEAHQRGMRVILDLVLNHTSDEHPWFRESKSSRDNPKADWYVWADAVPSPPAPSRSTPVEPPKGEGSPPNNWQSCFDGQAWTFAPERGQYYYHYFMKQQPDLNWHNPAVKQAMWEAARFWLDLGVDGFRLDAIGTLFEDPSLTPHSVPMNLAELRRAGELAQTPEARAEVEDHWREMFKNQVDQPGVHAVMKDLRAVLGQYDGDRMLVGEDEHIEYLGDGMDELQLVFNFPLMRTERLGPEQIRSNQEQRLSRLEALPFEGWPCNTLGNHDTSRLYTRYGDGLHNAELARLNLALVLTLRGTPFLYNGEEIGMTDLPITDPDRLRDRMATWYYHSLVNDLGVAPAEAAERAAAMTRDKNRTPMQWSNDPNAGFCPREVTPWLPVHPNYAQSINVRDQEGSPNSLLTYYKRLLQLRRQTPALIEGTYSVVHPTALDYLAFLRKTEHQSVLVILNYSELHLHLNFTDLAGGHDPSLQVLFSSADRAHLQTGAGNVPLAPFEVLIAEVQSPGR